MSFGWTRRVAVAAGTSGALTLALASTASAHVGTGIDGGFAAGFAHPFAGPDHVLAMIAIGVWAAQQGGRALWAIPASFVAAMIAGGALGRVGVTLPMTEPAVALSVLVLAGMVIAAVRLPLAFGATVAAVLALFHGHAHGVEMPPAVSALRFVAGFVAATIGLHVMGVALAMARARVRFSRAASLARERYFA